MTFPILDVSAWPTVREEPMGGKPKEWRADPGGRLWLFKEVNRRTPAGSGSADELLGEDWAEKIASELAQLVDVPAATVELAKDGDRQGCVSLQIQTDEEELAHGNELMWERDADYPRSGTFGIWYAVDAALDALARATASAPLDAAQFVAYLWFDAWIANTDRHHENWAVVRAPGGIVRLAPSFDHASSLGFNLSDRERDERLSSSDRGRSVAAWTSRSKTSPFHSQGKRLTLVEAARQSTKLAGVPAEDLRERCSDCLAAAEKIVSDVPESVMSDAAKSFALTILTINATRVLP